MKKTSSKIRIDLLLVDKGLAPTRAKAQALVLAGKILVDGEVCSKAGKEIDSFARVTIAAGPKYVSRGGEKLEGALADLNLSPAGQVCVDIGSSTGGFTDCLLQQGAVKVYAIDVGTHQMIDSLREDRRVALFEQTHILDFSAEKFDEKPTFCVIDVSFISLAKILAKVKALLPAGATVLALVKPQFEVGPQFLKKGVVRSEEIAMKAVDDAAEFAKKLDFDYLAQRPSHLKGPKGNQEYFIHLKTPQ